MRREPGPGPRAIRVSPCRRRDSTCYSLCWDCPNRRRATRTSHYPRRAPRSGRWGQVATSTRTSSTGRGPGRDCATVRVRVPGARRSLLPRGRVSLITPEVDSDGGRGKGHAVPYSRYTAPDIAPSSVLFSAITWPHGVRFLTQCLARSHFFSRKAKRIFQLLFHFEEVLRVLAGDSLLSDAASSQTKLGLSATAYCRTPRPVLCR